jgi:hypothetical protein
MSKYIPVDPDKWVEMVKAMSEVVVLKAEVERLNKKILDDANLPFGMGGTSLLKDLHDRLTAHRYFCAKYGFQSEQIEKGDPKIV